MAQLDIAEQPGRRRRESPIRLIEQPRPRGLVSQLSMLLFQPTAFFRMIAANDGSRQWLVSAFLILAIAGFTAVRQASLAETNAAPGGDVIFDPGMMDAGMGGPGGMGVMPLDAGIPPDMGMGGPGGGAPPTSGASSVSTTWTTALIAAGSFVAIWLVQSVILCEVSLLNGRGPKLGRNLQIAVFASLPLALMAILQLIYYSAGGDMGEPGLTGLAREWSGLATLSPFAQAAVMSLASRFTLFWLWSLVLLYLGARHALKGRWWASTLVIVAWVAVAVFVPVVTGAIQAPTIEEPISTGAPGMMDGGESLPGDVMDGMPPDTSERSSEGELDGGPPGMLDSVESGSVEATDGVRPVAPPADSDTADAADAAIQSESAESYPADVLPLETAPVRGIIGG